MLSALGDFLWQVITGLVAIGIASLIGFTFRAKIMTQLERVKNYLFDSKVQIKLTRVDRYTNPPSSSPDMQLFDELKNDFEQLTFEGLSEDYLRVSVPEIPTPLEIRVEHEPSFEDQLTDNDRYELRVETQTKMTFGYRSDECLRDFERVAEDVSNRVARRFSERPTATFLTGTLYGQAPIHDEEIEDEELGMRAQLNDSTLEMRFDDPRRLTHGIRKYFRPLQ